MDWSPVWISLETSVTATLIVMVVGLAAAAWRERHNGPVMALVEADDGRAHRPGHVFRRKCVPDRFR